MAVIRVSINVSVCFVFFFSCCCCACHLVLALAWCTVPLCFTRKKKKKQKITHCLFACTLFVKDWSFLHRVALPNNFAQRWTVKCEFHRPETHTHTLSRHHCLRGKATPEAVAQSVSAHEVYACPGLVARLGANSGSPVPVFRKTRNASRRQRQRGFSAAMIMMIICRKRSVKGWEGRQVLYHSTCYLSIVKFVISIV